MSVDDTSSESPPDGNTARWISSDEQNALPRKMRHELRTKIGHVIGYSELWLDEIGDDARQIDRIRLEEDLNRIHAAGCHILDLVNAYIDPIGPRARAEAAHSDGPELSGAELSSGEGFAAVDSCANTPSGDHAGARLLIAHNDSANVESLEGWLSERGHTLAVARSGQEARRLIETEPFDLVLLDALLPEPDGVEVLEWIKAHERLHPTPVIMISTGDSISVVPRCIEIGAEDFLIGPFDPVLVQARIADGLEKRRFKERERMLLAQIEEYRIQIRELTAQRENLNRA